jgi:2-aminoadipate transaminase
MQEATAQVLRDTPREALQYAASEGFGPLREWVAAELARQGLAVSAEQVLITTGSQQGLDLVGKVLIDPASRVAVESPTYLGALQAFAPYEPEFTSLVGDAAGPLPKALAAARGARFAYLVPNFQNPSGRCITGERRVALMAAALDAGLPVVEDNPYGELWYDTPPPPPMAAIAPEQAVYLGSFSKVLAPGLRLGWLVAPRQLFPKLLQAKQAADLHTPGFNQRVAYAVVQDGFLDRHVPTIRERYRRNRNAMAAALEAHLPAGCRWALPAGGMFFWVELPGHLDATALLPAAVQAGVAYVPGADFYPSGAGAGDTRPANTLRLSFVTATPEQIASAVATLGRVLSAATAEGEHSTHPAMKATA